MNSRRTTRGGGLAGGLQGGPHAGYGWRLESRRFLPGTPGTREAKSPGQRQAVGLSFGEAA